MLLRQNFFKSLYTTCRSTADKHIQHAFVIWPTCGEKKTKYLTHYKGVQGSYLLLLRKQFGSEPLFMIWLFLQVQKYKLLSLYSLQ